MSQPNYTAEQIDSIQFDLAQQLRTARRRSAELMEKTAKAKSITDLPSQHFLDMADFTDRTAALEHFNNRLTEAGADAAAIQKVLKSTRRNCLGEVLYADPARTNQHRMRAAQVIVGIFADAETL